MMFLYSIFDKVQGQYSAPVLANNDGVAIRWYVNMVNKGEFDATDFQLYKVASFDIDTGYVVPMFDFIKAVQNGEKVEGDMLDE